MIKVSKEGIKAAAATAIDIANRSGKSETTKVVINKPFLFTISLAKERNQNSKSDDAAIQTQLFMGSVSEINPVQSWFHRINHRIKLWSKLYYRAFMSWSSWCQCDIICDFNFKLLSEL